MTLSDPIDDPNASKTANGEEKTPEAGNKKVDFVPPLAPLKGTSKLPLMVATISLLSAI